MSIKESNLAAINAEDLKDTDFVRVLDGNVSRRMLVSEFKEVIGSGGNSVLSNQIVYDADTKTMSFKTDDVERMTINGVGQVKPAVLEPTTSLTIGTGATFNANTARLQGVGDPTAAQDAVTLNYINNTFTDSSDTDTLSIRSTFAGSFRTATMNNSTTKMRWYRVGDLVHYEAECQISDKGTMQASDYVLLWGLPFRPYASDATASVGRVTSANLPAAGYNISGRVNYDASLAVAYIDLYLADTTNGNSQLLVSEIDSTFFISVSGTYLADPLYY